jgi:hypothetical protein
VDPKEIEGTVIKELQDKGPEANGSEIEGTVMKELQDKGPEANGSEDGISRESDDTV